MHLLNEAKLESVKFLYYFILMAMKILVTVSTSIEGKNRQDKEKHLELLIL